jgi:hypothetical protein
MADENEIRAGLSWEDYDVLAWTRINKEWLELERGLMTSKWFDYRFLHPVQATLVYANAFHKAYRAAFASTIDHRAAEHIRLFDEATLFEPESKAHKIRLAGLWRGRQVADAIGMPYEVYCTMALKETLRYWKQRYLPQPAQIYSERIVERVVEAWAERQKAILMFSRLPIYRNERYLGTQPQNDHHEWLFTQAQLRADPVSWVGEFVRQELIPAAKVRSRFESETIERIRDLL